MGQNQAFREVSDIKRIMESSRRQRLARSLSTGAILLITAIAAVFFILLIVAIKTPFLITFLAPALAIPLLASGIVAYRRTDAPATRRIALVAIALGVLLFLVGIFLIAGVMFLRGAD
ncbi:MAG: hypothetical protein WD333_11990 [Dehalococcoidia bacterium]